MNPVIETMLNWKSCKKYLPTPVEDLYLQQIAKAGTFAPSGMNRQASKILVVTNQTLRDKLSRMNAEVLGVDTDPFYGAPAVLVVLASKDVPTRVYDGSLVMENLMLAARSLGLGSCWIHRAKEVFESEEGKAILDDLGIEGEWEGIGHCIVGYPVPGSDHPDRPRKADYVTWVK